MCNGASSKSELSQDDSSFLVNDVTDNCVSSEVDNNCSYTDIHHSCNDFQMDLKPCKSVDCAGNFVVYYHLQYKAAYVGWQPWMQPMSSIYVHLQGIVWPKVNTNFTNSLSQGGCQSSKYIRVENP